MNRASEAAKLREVKVTKAVVKSTKQVREKQQQTAAIGALSHTHSHTPSCHGDIIRREGIWGVGIQEP